MVIATKAPPLPPPLLQAAVVWRVALLVGGKAQEAVRAGVESLILQELLVQAAEAKGDSQGAHNKYVRPVEPRVRTINMWSPGLGGPGRQARAFRCASTVAASCIPLSDLSLRCSYFPNKGCEECRRPAVSPAGRGAAPPSSLPLLPLVCPPAHHSSP